MCLKLALEIVNWNMYKTAILMDFSQFNFSYPWGIP